MADHSIDDQNDNRHGDHDVPGEGPQIEATSEMEEALREATESIETRHGERGHVATASSDASSADKMTIELLSTELQDLKSLHDETIKKSSEADEKSLRLQAEFENFRRRSLKEKQESFKFGHQNLVKDLLSVVDNLERALEHGAQNAESDVKGIVDGVELVHREILGAFAKHGVKEIEAEGQLFDPSVHEALGQIPNADMPVNSVLEVLQKGYVIFDRMLRPARVIVSCEAGGSESDSEANAEAESAETESA